MKQLLLVGAGGMGRVVLEHASNDYECYFVDDNASDAINGCKVVGRINDLKTLRNEFELLVVTIGNNKLRENIYSIASELGYTFPNIVVQSAYISPYAEIGRGCIILNYVVVQNGAKVGNGVILNAGVELHQDSVVGNNVLIYANTVVRSLANISDRVCLQSTITVGTGVKIMSDEIVEQSMF